MPPPRREPDKDDWIIFAADFLVDHLTPEGRVEILDAQYPESHMYLAGAVPGMVLGLRHMQMGLKKVPRGRVAEAPGDGREREESR